jgi:hypothetical protein
VHRVVVGVQGHVMMAPQPHRGRPAHRGRRGRQLQHRRGVSSPTISRPTPQAATGTGVGQQQPRGELVVEVPLSATATDMYNVTVTKSGACKTKSAIAQTRFRRIRLPCIGPVPRPCCPPMTQCRPSLADYLGCRTGGVKGESSAVQSISSSAATSPDDQVGARVAVRCVAQSRADRG